jgi:large subunit ribosomal protein L10
MDGGRLGAADVKRVAKWPSRGEQLSILSGQISSLGSLLSGQILSAGGALAGQIASRVDELEKSGDSAGA